MRVKAVQLYSLSFMYHMYCGILSHCGGIRPTYPSTLQTDGQTNLDYTVNTQTDRRPDSLHTSSGVETNATSAAAGSDRQDERTVQVDGTGRDGCGWQWGGTHTYRGGSAGYAHKPNSN